jgi:hypothetical protein
MKARSRVDSARKKRPIDTGATAGEPARKLKRDDLLLLAGADPLAATAKASVPSVQLRPRLKIEDDKIARVIISGLQRTPSPFGSKMGDHTVAWQAVVDQLHSLLHGRSVTDAIAELRQQQEAASAWMGDADSEGSELLGQLEDAAWRRVLLEHAAGQASTLIGGAEAATGDDQRRGLEQAIAWHLTYLNYLPFATVPAKSARGSHGSGEGRHRAIILDEERKGSLAANADVSGANPVALKGALWGMFAFDAALREAGTEMAVVPASVKDTIEDSRKLTELASRVMKQIGKARGKQLDSAELTAILTDVTPYLARSASYPELNALAGHIRDVATYLDVFTTSRQLTSFENKIEAGVLAAGELSDSITKQSEQAVANAALILAHLLGDHQATVAHAYPRSVTVSEFLKPSPAQAATQTLAQEIRNQYRDLDGKRLDALLEKVTEHLDRRNPIVVGASDWAKGATTEGLVVTHTPGRPLMVNGRAPAPAGVAGMGSHTTAWIVETMAADALVTGASGPGADPVAALREEVARDLIKGSIELDSLLPAEQLQAGQLESVFDNALEVFKATNVEDAATAFLMFRNVLPYATVDSGDRGGHGETSRASESETLDADALDQAAQTQAAALTDPQLRIDSSAALRETADRLASPANPEWATHDEVSRAVAASISRLRAQAQKQDTEPQNRQSIIDSITKIRKQEHKRTYKTSRSSALTRK